MTNLSNSSSKWKVENISVKSHLKRRVNHRLKMSKQKFWICRRRLTRANKSLKISQSKFKKPTRDKLRLNRSWGNFKPSHLLRNSQRLLQWTSKSRAATRVNNREDHLVSRSIKTRTRMVRFKLTRERRARRLLWSEVHRETSQRRKLARLKSKIKRRRKRRRRRSRRATPRSELTNLNLSFSK